jgi:hypothetical protein
MGLGDLGFVPVILTEDDYKAAAKLVEHAETYVLSHQDMKRIQTGFDPPAGADPARQIIMGGVIRCVFTHEYQPCGLCRHLSLSVIEEVGTKIVPSRLVAYIAAKFFGFDIKDKGAVDVLTVYLEANEEPAAPPVFNLIQRIHEPE